MVAIQAPDDYEATIRAYIIGQVAQCVLDGNYDDTLTETQAQAGRALTDREAALVKSIIGYAFAEPAGELNVDLPEGFVVTFTARLVQLVHQREAEWIALKKAPPSSD